MCLCCQPWTDASNSRACGGHSTSASCFWHGYRLLAPTRPAPSAPPPGVKLHRPSASRATLPAPTASHSEPVGVGRSAAAAWSRSASARSAHVRPIGLLESIRVTRVHQGRGYLREKTAEGGQRHPSPAAVVSGPAGACGRRGAVGGCCVSPNMTYAVAGVRITRAPPAEEVASSRLQGVRWHYWGPLEGLRRVRPARPSACRPVMPLPAWQCCHCI